MHDRRRTDRIPVKVAVSCDVQGHHGPATVYDVSVDGCMVEMTSGLASHGAAIVISFASDIRIAGTVIWVKERNAGVQFTEPMAAAMMEHLGFAPPVDLHPTAMRDHFGRPLPRVRGLGRPRFI